MRQVSPGKQRASVRAADRPSRFSFSKDGGHGSGGHGSGGHGSGGHGSGREPEPRTYPALVLGLVLVGGILLGLVFAGVISSFVGGSSDSSSSASDRSGSGSTAKPKATASGQSGRTQTGQKSGSMYAADSPESRDVRILGCGADAEGFASARVQITNSTTQRATYYVRVVFTTRGDGRLVSDDVASVKRLPPGQTAPLQTVRAVDAAPGEEVECVLGSVSRF